MSATPRQTQGQRDRAFSETADPTAYVPRAATETVLSTLETWTGEGVAGPTVAALIAPPGLGKTFLLRLMESRLDRRTSMPGSPQRVLYLPYAGLLPRDLCEWIYGLLGRVLGSPTGDESEEEEASKFAQRALIDLAESDQSPFFLLVDDADSMPPETIRMLVDGLPRERSPLRILMSLNPDAKSSRLLAALDSLGILEVRLEEAMTEPETAAYLRGRMRWAGLEMPEAVGAEEAQSLRRIHALSGGVPRRVHRVAESVFGAAGADRPSDLDTKRNREDWLGSPIEDDL